MSRKNENIGHIKYDHKFYYVLGLIATDGNIHKSTLSYAISRKDEELIEYFRQVFCNFRYKISYRVQEQNSGYISNSVRIRINSSYLCKILSDLGINPAKSLTISRIVVPNNYWIDFFRGCIDGDGSVSNRRNSIELEMNSGSKHFLEFLLYENNRILGLPIKNILYKTKNKSVCYRFSYYKTDLLSIRDILYYNGASCLQRKRNKIFFEPVVSMYYWQDWQLRYLRNRYILGDSYESIGIFVGRSAKAVGKKIWELGLCQEKKLARRT